MLGLPKHKWLLWWLATFAIAHPATARAQVLHLDSIPVGFRPLGIDIAIPPTNFVDGKVYAAIANSGDNSVSVLSVDIDPKNVKTITVLTAVTGIPAPYAVASCLYGGIVLVTSPSDNSVRVLQLPGGTVAGKLQVGPQPYSAACYGGTGAKKGVVSNLGDNSLVIFDLATLAVTATIPGVPGSRGFHGIAVSANSTSSIVAWVAGTDANVVTVVDLINFRVLTQIPVSRPTAVLASAGSSSATISIASAGDNRITIYDRDTAKVISTIQNVPNPQDFTFSRLGTFATIGDIGDKDSLSRLDTSRGTTSTIPGIPGAAALASFSFSASPLPETAVVLVTSTNSNSVFLIQQQPSLPAQFSMANAASFGTSQTAPGSLSSVIAQTGVSQPSFASSLPLPTSLGKVTLNIGGTLQFGTSGWTYSATGSSLAPLLFVGPTQVNFQIPPGIAPGDSIPAQLTKADGATLLTTVRIVASSPGIFTVLANGQGQAAALNPDYSQNGNPQSILGAKPAQRGTYISIFATGAGTTNPSLGAGEPAPASGNPLVFTQVQPAVTIGGKTARVLFSGLTPTLVGVWQINVEIPADVTPGSAVPLSITAGGVTSNTVTIAVQ